MLLDSDKNGTPLEQGGPPVLVNAGHDCAIAEEGGQLNGEARAAAQGYLALGFCPVPVPARSKAALRKGWPQLRRENFDLAIIEDGGNVGLLLGEPSGGLVDVDLDSPQALIVADYLMPATSRVSGRRSNPKSHLWYRVENPPAKAQEEFHDLEINGEDDSARTMIVELRSTGGMTIAPPSIHPSGESYEWYADGDPALVSIDDLRLAVRDVAAAAILARHWPCKGSRQNATMALAGALLRTGMSTHRVERFVQAVTAAAHDDEGYKRVQTVVRTESNLREGRPVYGWTALADYIRKDAVEKARSWLNPKASVGSLGTASGLSGGRYGAQQRRRFIPLPPFRAFPIEIIPEPWATFCRQGADTLRCDPTYVIFPVIAALAGAIGNTRGVWLGGEWREPIVHWMCVVGDSGTAKSPASEFVMGMVKQRQKVLIAEYKRAIEAHEQELHAVKAAARTQKCNTGGVPPEPPAPKLHRILASDLTIEKLAEMLDDNPRGLLVHRDELAGWIGSFTKYKKAGGSDEPNWLSIFRAEAIIVDRKTGNRTSIFVPHAAVSIFGGIQPSKLKQLIDEDLLASGLAARITFTMPPRTPKVYVERGIDQNVKDAAAKSLDTLYALEGDLDCDGEPRPVALALTRPALDRWKEFVDDWGRRQFVADGDMAAALAKLEAYAARFALLHHVVSHGGTSEQTNPVGLVSIEAGITFAQWCSYETERVYTMFRETREETAVRRLLDHVTRLAGRYDDKVRVRDFRRATHPKYSSSEAAKAELQSLVEYGLAEWVTVPPNGPGSRETEVLVLHPTPDNPDDLADDGDDDRGGACCGRPDNAPVPSEPSRGTPVSDAEENAANKGSSVGPTEPPEQDPSGLSGNEAGREGNADVPSAPQATQERGLAPTGTVPGSPMYTIVADQQALDSVIRAVEESGIVCLDIETTGLSPLTDRARLLQVDCGPDEGVRKVYVIDLETVDPAKLWPVLAEKTLIVFNAAFDLGFLARLGFVPNKPVIDPMIISRVLNAGRMGDEWGNDLRSCCERYLGRKLDKETAKSDWTAALTDRQIEYAATDAAVLLPLYKAIKKHVAAHKLEATVDVETRALMTVLWMSRTGVMLDAYAWRTLTNQSGQQKEAFKNELDKLLPGDPNVPEGGPWNWQSPAQIKRAFSTIGIHLKSTDADTLAELSHPAAEVLLNYRDAQKRSSTYGSGFLENVKDSRVFARWNQLGAKSGRMTCSSPNLQNLPRDLRYRRCFVAPPGRMLVKADYSQIELRIAARISGDAALLQAYRDGVDLHTLTAQRVLGVETPSKDDRQLAKAINFGLLFGMGAPGFQDYAKSGFGVKLSLAQAEAYRNAFFASYPGLKAWHQRTGYTGSRGIEVRTQIGRARFDVTTFTEKLNAPVQGTGADGLKTALALLWERREQCLSAVPVLAVHDEIVIEVDEAEAVAASEWLKGAMLDAMSPMIAPVPVVVDVSSSKTWGGDQ